MSLPDVIYPGQSQIEDFGEHGEVSDGGGVLVFHADLAASRVIEFWKNKEAFQAWLRCYSEECQALETAAWDVLVCRWPDYAFGESLDLIGRIVGAPRNGRADPAYRARVKAQILINQSFGRAKDIAAILRLISESAFRYIEYPSGAAHFGIVYEVPAETRAVQMEIPSIVWDSKAAGVSAGITQPMLSPGIASLNLPFRFADADGNAGPLPGAGLGWTSGTYGGALSHYERR